MSTIAAWEPEIGPGCGLRCTQSVSLEKHDGDRRTCLIEFVARCRRAAGPATRLSAVLSWRRRLWDHRRRTVAARAARLSRCRPLDSDERDDMACPRDDLRLRRRDRRRFPAHGGTRLGPARDAP